MARWHHGAAGSAGRGPPRARPGSSLEFAVSLTASIALHLLRRGDPVTVVTEDGAELTGPAPPVAERRCWTRSRRCAPRRGRS